MVIFKMASVGVCRTWCRVLYLKQTKGLVHCTVPRAYASTTAKEKEGVFHRVKKFVFGEEETPEQSDGDEER